MIVEDEHLIALSIAGLLEKNGYHVTGMHSKGEDVLSALEGSPIPDLFLIDVTLSGELNGIQTVRHIQDRLSTPVLFITGNESEKMDIEMDELNPDGIVYKPYVSTDLLTLIRATIGSSTN